MTYILLIIKLLFVPRGPFFVAVRLASPQALTIGSLGFIIFTTVLMIITDLKPGYQVVDCPTHVLGFSFVVFHDKAKRTQQGNLLVVKLFRRTCARYTDSPPLTVTLSGLTWSGLSTLISSC